MEVLPAPPCRVLSLSFVADRVRSPPVPLLPPAGLRPCHGLSASISLSVKWGESSVCLLVCLRGTFGGEVGVSLCMWQVLLKQKCPGGRAGGASAGQRPGTCSGSEPGGLCHLLLWVVGLARSGLGGRPDGACCFQGSGWHETWEHGPPHADCQRGGTEPGAGPCADSHQRGHPR